MSSSNDFESLIKTLHPLERKVIIHLLTNSSFDYIVSSSKLKDIEVMRALQWLENKQILKISETTQDLIELDSNGYLYAEKGLPENRFLQAIKDTNEKSPLTISEITSKHLVEQAEVNVCMGLLKRKVAIEIIKDKELSIYITEQGKKILNSKSLEEKFLTHKFPVSVSKLSDEDKYAFNELKSRKQIVKQELKKTRFIELTKLGKDFVKEFSKLSSSSKIKDELGKLTPEIIKSGSWKNNTFRAYDIKADVPKLSYGKRHFVNQAMDYIKQIWLDMGFVEMTGNHVQTAFWDLDVLYVPQDHPAREMQDTFYVKNPSLGTLPKSFSKKVSQIHEDGGETGSKGWQYNWDEKIAKQILLRTHTTVLSALKISELKVEDLPLKFFSVGKVYRNEALDWKHLFEFHQVEGIVIDPNANMSHLKGYLKEFYSKMGFSDIRIKPSHFPYTEPSAEVEVFDSKRKEWIELGGCGIFRPEVVQPIFGIAVPVLAWGNGMERIIKAYYELSDIRDLYNNDLKKIKKMKAWMK